MAKTNDRVHLNQRDRLLILGFWILFGLLETTGTYVAAKGTDAPVPFDTAVLAKMQFWLVWGMLTPVAFWIAWRFRFQEGKQVRFALVHFPFARIRANGLGARDQLIGDTRARRNHDDEFVASVANRLDASCDILDPLDVTH